jgi:hypothetical protein
MWVVFCLQSGEEQSTFSTREEAERSALYLELTNTWGESYDVRFEQD